MTIKGYIHPTELEQLVNCKLKEMGITKLNYPIDPYELIHKEGIFLQETPFDDDNIRGMIVHGPNVSGILINANRNLYSKRFIAMHELSHSWFHPHETKTICFEEYKKQKKGIEWQANNAAAYALMPSEIVIELFEHCNGDLEYMCNFFKVGKDSLTYRITELKLSIKTKNEHVHNFVNERDSTLELLEMQWLYSGL